MSCQRQTNKLAQQRVHFADRYYVDVIIEIQHWAKNISIIGLKLGQHTDADGVVKHLEALVEQKSNTRFIKHLFIHD